MEAIDASRLARVTVLYVLLKLLSVDGPCCGFLAAAGTVLATRETNAPRHKTRNELCADMMPPVIQPRVSAGHDQRFLR